MRRVSLGPLNLGDLPEANYRSLAPSEVEQLRRAIGRAEKAPRTPVSKRIRRFRGKWAATRGANNAPSVPPPIDMRSGQAPTGAVGRGSAPPTPTILPRNAPANTYASRPPVSATPPGRDPRNSYGGPGRSSPGGKPFGRVPPGRTSPGHTSPGGGPRNSTADTGTVHLEASRSGAYRRGARHPVLHRLDAILATLMADRGAVHVEAIRPAAYRRGARHRHVPGRGPCDLMADRGGVHLEAAVRARTVGEHVARTHVARERSSQSYGGPGRSSPGGKPLGA